MLAGESNIGRRLTLWLLGDPRYQGEAFKLNMRIVEKIQQLAAEKSKAIGQGVTPASFCLAWVLFQGEDFFVIPGTKSSDRFKVSHKLPETLARFRRLTSINRKI